MFQLVTEKDDKNFSLKNIYVAKQNLKYSTTLLMTRMMKMTGEIFVSGKMVEGKSHYAVKSVARSLRMVMSVSLKNSEW